MLAHYDAGALAGEPPISGAEDGNSAPNRNLSMSQLPANRPPVVDIQWAANAPRISSVFLQRARRKGDNFEKRSMARERSEVPTEA